MKNENTKPIFEAGALWVRRAAYLGSTALQRGFEAWLGGFEGRTRCFIFNKMVASTATFFRLSPFPSFQTIERMTPPSTRKVTYAVVGIF